MNCKYCNQTMNLEGNHYCCDNCGATFFTKDEEWTNPVVPRSQWSTPKQPKTICFRDVLDNICNVLSDMDEDDIVKINNEICAKKIRYVEGSLTPWEFTGENDNNP